MTRYDGDLEIGIEKDRPVAFAGMGRIVTSIGVSVGIVFKTGLVRSDERGIVLRGTCPYQPRCVEQFSDELRKYCSNGGECCRIYELNKSDGERRD